MGNFLILRRPLSGCLEERTALIQAVSISHRLESGKTRLKYHIIVILSMPGDGMTFRGTARILWAAEITPGGACPSRRLPSG